MLNPTMRSGWPLKRDETRLMTPGVSILQEKYVIMTSLNGFHPGNTAVYLCITKNMIKKSKFLPASNQLAR